MSGLVPDDCLCSVTLYLKKISVCVFILVFQYIYVCCSILYAIVFSCTDFSRCGLAGSGAHLNGGFGVGRGVWDLWFPSFMPNSLWDFCTL